MRSDFRLLHRLYPVTPQNQSNFPGKQLFFENTIRIHGTVHFVDATGQPAQPMQGVNVTARWIDPITGLPSRTYAAASVSGFLFRGYAGNPVNGPNYGTGQPFDRFGSDGTAVEGAFDLAGLEIPDSSGSARYELTVETIDPLWSQPVGPYGPWQVQPSGATSPIVVTVSEGGNAQQDIVMQSSAVQVPDWFDPVDYTSPALLPARLEPVAGSVQVVSTGQNFQPVTVRVTDSSTPPNPVRAVDVIFESIVTRPSRTAPILTTGETVITHNAMPIILSSSQASVPSDANGLATIQPSPGRIQGSTLIVGTTTAGTSTLQCALESLSPVNPGPGNARRVDAHGRMKLPIRSELK